MGELESVPLPVIAGTGDETAAYSIDPDVGSGVPLCGQR
jgi:hypothetical protein